MVFIEKTLLFVISMHSLLFHFQENCDCVIQFLFSDIPAVVVENFQKQFMLKLCWGW